MKGLSGVLSASNLSLVKEATKLRFQDASQFKTPEALIVYEQNMLDDEKLLEICSAEYSERVGERVHRVQLRAYSVRYAL